MVNGLSKDSKRHAGRLRYSWLCMVEDDQSDSILAIFWMALVKLEGSS